MSHSNRFNCHSYLDNTNFAILEISTKVGLSTHAVASYHWLLINKITLQIKTFHLKSRDDSAWVQERFFDLGYVKYDASNGVFIAQDSNELYPLEIMNCNDIPENLLKAVDDYLSTNKSSAESHHLHD